MYDRRIHHGCPSTPLWVAHKTWSRYKTITATIAEYSLYSKVLKESTHCSVVIL